MSPYRVAPDELAEAAPTRDRDLFVVGLITWVSALVCVVDSIRSGIVFGAFETVALLMVLFIPGIGYGMTRR